jgi:capsular polysaccharide biosynthesis protein
VTAVAPDPNVAAAVANAIGQVGETQMGQLYPMYALTVVTEATPPVGVYRPDVKRNASVGLVLGLLAGAFAAYAYDALALRPRKPNG